ncbi:SDR family NAD(P)-dependent oxidoreductase [Chitinophaga agri]|uniref:SDR family NAD(P)-dependent oxidoreductase n=1 Tax=Chitinophaga agri TaxID=2703787 RepID=A0A6B9ZJ87_9BACT|nr:SDR family NAD(P)-dependent oxidoreductase [Chitinophaga agri]QHS61145.1 SDR family NAD(P)-dependent oxidoreductase [Chitinophaga agri]
MAKIIFITGASRGFGKAWAEALLKRGDKVAATARDTSSLNDLKEKYGNAVLPLQLDVHDRTAAFSAIQQAYKHFGRIDVVINNAGYGLQGAIEETTEEQARKQMETNFFGLLWVTQAALPVMREQKNGHIIQVSSFLGHATLPTLGLYNASKFAVEGLSETLAAEVKPFGIKISLVEPNGYATEFWGGSSYAQTEHTPLYDPLREAIQNTVKPEHFGKMEATNVALLKLIDSPNPPLRLFMGKIAYPVVKQVYEQRLAEWEAWNDVAIAAHG